jgi:hypothetical protein
MKMSKPIDVDSFIADFRPGISDGRAGRGSCRKKLLMKVGEKREKAVRMFLWI